MIYLKIYLLIWFLSSIIIYIGFKKNGSDSEYLFLACLMLNVLWPFYGIAIFCRAFIGIEEWAVKKFLSYIDYWKL